MVMKTVMQKNLLRSIRKSLARYIAIVAIIALGSGMFVGLRTTKGDMIATGQKYMDGQNMFDLRLLNTYGWTEEQLSEIKELSGVKDAEGVISLDALARPENQGSADKVYKFYALPERVDKACLQGGRMPENPGECLLDGFHASDKVLGSTITISSENEQGTLDSFASHTLTVVGYVSSPLYMDMSRGSTSLGNGSVAGFIYLPKDSFQVDYYTEIAVTIDGSRQAYTKEYDEAVDKVADALEPPVLLLARQRYEQLRQDAQTQYDDGMEEYLSGYRDYLHAKEKAIQELADGKKELMEAQRELEDNRAVLKDGQAQLEDAEALLAQKKKELADGEKELKAQEYAANAQLEDAEKELLKNYKTVSENLALVNDGLLQINEGLSQLDSGISQLENGLSRLKTGIDILAGLDSAAESGLAAAREALDEAQSMGVSDSVIAELRAQLDRLEQEKQNIVQQQEALQQQYDEYSGQLQQLQNQRGEVIAQRQEILSNKAALEDGLRQINDGLAQLEEKKEQAKEELNRAKALLNEGKAQIAAGEAELSEKRAQLQEGMEALEAGEKALAEGWDSYNSGKETALRELADAQAELDDAKRKLDDAADTIASMTEPSLYLMSRNTNVGYLALDSNSDIVKGVSTVFPAFFLLIAALVCITTMTRMVEEERTEIGTMKALGYKNREIIRKYLLYSGSAAIIGCGLGVVLGSIIFPIILWRAYGILFNIVPRVELRMDWALCGTVVLTYIAVNLLVTWYCCRRMLTNVPSELIRPKAPTAGKKVFLEYLPFWNRVSFLNKVMIRNVVRYKQRLFMMLLGIGGCTALLLTGFGIRDSIVDIVDHQFEEITLYDMEIRFSQGRTQQQMDDFSREMGSYAEDVYFYHQSSGELSAGGETKAVTMICADEGITRFMDFHYDGKQISMPGENETIVSAGVANMMGLSVGDRITLRNSDMEEIDVTISGIYENYVYNYAVISVDTYSGQLGEAPALQVACVNVDKGQDVHIAGTKASKTDGVLNVTISQDLAEQVGTMLEALDLVVATVVICAGALAVIVLYNLTNINITERIREIATIKVLGFRAGETAAYVFKENLLLSAIGAGLGLLGGRLLLSFVISQIKVDVVWLQARISAPSFILSIVLTMLCACLVDFILYFRLEKINMAEALKSVE